MKKEEKQELYNFFKTAGDYIDGHKTYEAEPVFTDDSEEPISQNYADEKIVKPIQNTDTQANNNVIANNSSSSSTSIKIASSALYRIGSNSKPIKFMLLCEWIENHTHSNNSQDIFSGEAAILLDKMLGAINLKRDSNFSVHLLSEGKNDFDAFLDQQIAELKPSAILAVGNFAIQNLLKTSDEINKLHGKFFSYANLPVMSIFHPNALLRDANLKRPAWEDLKLFNSKLTQIENSY